MTMQCVKLVALGFYAFCLFSCATSRTKAALATYSEIRELCVEIDREIADQIDVVGERTMDSVVQSGLTGEQGYEEWDKRMTPYLEAAEITAYIRGALIEIEADYQDSLTGERVGSEFLVLLRPLVSHFQALISVLDETPSLRVPPEVQYILLKLLPVVPTRRPVFEEEP